MLSGELRRGFVRALLVVGILLSVHHGSAQTTCAAPCAAAPNLSTAPVAPAAAPAAADPRVAEVQAVDAQLDAATLRGDRAAVAAMLDDAMVSVSGFDGVRTRDRVLDRIRPRKGPALPPIAVSEVRVQAAGDVAVLTAKKTLTYEFEGHPDSRVYRETNTYARRDGRWKLICSVTSDEDPPYVAADVSFEADFDPAASLGSADAPIVVYEYSDYECPFCRRFAAETLARVERDYVANGRVAMVFRDNPLSMHPRASAAAAAGACSEKLGKRWPMSEKLLKDPPALSDEDLRRYAREIGLDGAAFDRCLSDPSIAARIQRGKDEGWAMGVKGAPIFLVGVRAPGEKRVRLVRRIDGAQPYEVFETTLNGVLRASGR
jgi:protein-disulfide isomerase/ketosteroid isomerase-like protein